MVKMANCQSLLVIETEIAFHFYLIENKQLTLTR